MELHGWWQVFAGGALGPLLVEVVKLSQMNRAQLRRKTRYWQYWVLAALLLVVGGIVTVAHGSEEMKLWTAMQLGASAPLLVGALANAKPPTAALRPEKPTVRDLLRW